MTSAVHASAQSSSINDHANQRYGYQHGRINERRKSDRETTLWIYDELGRVQEKTEKRHGFRDRTTQYKWNSDDQLTQVITPTKEVWQYQYDAFGRRITKYNPNTKETTHTLWDGDIIAREVRLTGQEAQKTHTEYWHYQPGSFEPIAKQIQSTNERTDELDYKTFYTVTDHIGSPRELFSADGNLAWRGYYSTWGSVHKEEIAGQFKTDCNLRYAGQYFDKESGLHYNRHRYYDPESSQYMSPDPIGLQGGLTPQSYAHNPNLFIDPLGLSICKARYDSYKDYRSLGYNAADAARLSKANAVKNLGPLRGKSVSQIEGTLSNSGFTRTNPANMRNQRWVHPDGSEVQIHKYGNVSTTPYKSGNNAHIHKSVGRHGRQNTFELDDFGMPSSNPSSTHIGIRNPSDYPVVAGRPHGT